MTVFFTSDTHFGHDNVIKFNNRPFASVEQMEDVIVENWNTVVKRGDCVYHLGDFGYLKREETERVLARLNGQKFLVCGNHDARSAVRNAKGWVGVCDMREVRAGEHKVICSHYAMRVWNRCHYGSLHLYGHSHGSLLGNSQSTDVGVDCWNFTPVTIDRLIERMKTLPPYKCPDHHAWIEEDPKDPEKQDKQSCLESLLAEGLSLVEHPTMTDPTKAQKTKDLYALVTHAASISPKYDLTDAPFPWGGNKRKRTK